MRDADLDAWAHALEACTRLAHQNPGHALDLADAFDRSDEPSLRLRAVWLRLEGDAHPDRVEVAAP